MDTHKDLLQFGVYQNILDKFNQLHEYDDIHLVFALGNHEVPVVDNYDNNFFTNKDNMLKKFNNVQKEMGSNYSFFKNDIFTQYVLLHPEEYGKPEPLIKLFDTRQDMVKDKAVNTLPLGVKTQSTDKTGKYYIPDKEEMLKELKTKYSPVVPLIWQYPKII